MITILDYIFRCLQRCRLNIPLPMAKLLVNKIGKEKGSFSNDTELFRKYERSF